MYSIYTVEALARERQLAALSAAGNARRLHEGQGPSTGNWEMFNHYHFWPVGSTHPHPQVAFNGEDDDRFVRRKPGLLEQFANFLFSRAETGSRQSPKTFEGPRVASFKQS